MPLPPYTRTTERFLCHGIDLNRPVDATQPGYFPILENVRSYTDGVIQPRQGLTPVSTSTTANVITGLSPVHTVRRLNDQTTSSGFLRIVGTATGLAYGVGTFTQATYGGSNVGLSGNPLTMVPFRPDQATAAWMYVADSSAMRKIVGNNADGLSTGTVHKVGVAPPTSPPFLAAITGTNYNNVFVASSSGASPFNWTADGTVLSTGVSTVTRVPAGSSVTAVIGGGGLGPSYVPIVVPQTVLDVTGVGTIMWSTNGFSNSQLIVHEVHRPSSTSTGLTVSSVLYDSSTGVTGNCIVAPSQSVAEFQRNAVVQFNSSQRAAITDVILGPDGTRTFRCSTTGTIVAGQTVQVLPTLYVWDNTSPIINSGSTLADSAGGAGGVVQATGAGTATTKTGWVQITTSTPRDLSQLADASVLVSNGPAFADDDFVHTSILMSDLSRLSQGRLLFDVDTTSLAISSISTSATIAGETVTTVTVHNLSSGDTVFISGTGGTVGTFIVSSSTSTSTFQFLTTSTSTSGLVGTVQPQFKKNFYYRAFTANDLVPVTKGSQTALSGQTNIIGNQPIDIPLKLAPGYRSGTGRIQDGGNNETIGPFDRTDIIRERNPNIPDDPNAPIPSGTSRTQAGSGDFQWSELRFRKADLQRVGQGGQTLAKTNAMRVEFTFTDTTPVTVGVNSNLMFGGYPLDSSELGIPYIYRYRYRVSATGAVSNWSPATRSGTTCMRDKIAVAFNLSFDTEVDRVDIQRLGGTNTTWLTVSTVDTTASNLAYDIVSDLAATAAAPVSDLDTNYQLWPIVQHPISGTTAVVGVVGPYIVDSGTNFNLAWAKGTPIKVNGIDTSIRRVLSTSKLEVEDSLGSLSSVKWEIPAPLLTGQPLPALWVWNDIGFGCGDSTNPGRLYFTNPGSLDTTQDSFWLDITNPSEPLMNGIMHNGKNYVWSSERMFEIEQIGPNMFIPVELPGRKGLIGRWGLTAAERIWWIAKDGIYQSNGGDSISITDDTLQSFFVREGNVGAVTNGFNPPDLTATSKLRLSYYDGYLYFIYQDTAGKLRCLTYIVRDAKPGWWPDVYLDTAGITTLYGEEGNGVHSLLAGGNNAGTAKLYTVGGTADDVGGIACHVRTRSFDADDRRANKYWGDLVLDADTQGETVNLSLGLNNHTTTVGLNPTIASTSTSRTQTIIDIGSSGAITEARNADLDIQWTGTLAPQMFLWEPSYITLPETALLRPTYWDDLGLEGDKFIQGIEIQTDTNNAARTILVEYDGGTLADTLTVQHNGNQTKAYSFHPAFIAHLVRLRPTDTGTSWQNFKYRWIYQPESPLADRWETQQTSFGANQFMHIKEAYVCLRSTSNVTLAVTRTDDNTTTNYTIPTTSGNRMRVRVPFTAPVSKGKAFVFVLTSTSAGSQFRLYKDDTSILAKEWASEQAFSSRSPWGAPHGDGQAPI